MKIEEIKVKKENIIMIVFGAILIDGSIWFNPPHSGYNLLIAPVFLGGYFIFAGIFDYNPRRILKGPSLKEFRESTRSPSENNNSTLSVEEQYYYKGKTNQQLQHYNEAWQCYTKSLRFNPNFEPSKRAIKEVENFITVNIKENPKKDWFKWEELIRMPKPIRWQGWACCGILLLSIFIFARLTIVYDINSWILTIFLAIAILLFLAVAILKSNYRELTNQYKKGI
jgi:tetratricopeptide (TPR) repeat protein